MIYTFAQLGENLPDVVLQGGTEYGAILAFAEQVNDVYSAKNLVASFGEGHWCISTRKGSGCTQLILKGCAEE